MSLYRPGRDYTVTLTVNNTNAGYAQSTVSKTIRTFMGAQDTARTPVSGIFFDSRFGGQDLTFDSPVPAGLFTSTASSLPGGLPPRRIRLGEYHVPCI